MPIYEEKLISPVAVHCIKECRMNDDYFCEQKRRDEKLVYIGQPPFMLPAAYGS